MRRIQYPKSADEAYRDLVRAVGQIGVVQSSSQLTRTVMGILDVAAGDGGAYTTHLQVSVIQVGSETCMLEIEAVSGTASVQRPEVIPLLVKALEDPTYRYKAGCLSVLLLGTLLGVAWYWVA